jgi:hypothetical protein
MGILANSVSVCHFQVVGDFPQGDLFDWIAGCLDKQAFRSIEEGAEELSIGWVRTDDYQNTDFTAGQPFRRDHYVSFSLRRDQRRIPTPLIKAYQHLAEQEFLAASPGFFRVPKQKREDIRDAVRLKLLARTLPGPAMYDAVWDTRSGLVTLASLSSKTIDLFESEFKKSFPGLRLIMIHPFARAEKVCPPAFAELLAKANLATTESILDLIRANQWLGKDFFLWLLYQTLTGSGEYHISRPGPAGSGEPFTAFMNDRLMLQSVGENGTQKITVCGAQDDFREVLAALRQGKSITEATVHLEKDENAWKLTLKGELFHFGSFKSPAVQIEKDSNVDRQAELEAVFFERMHLLETGLQLFDSLYAGFLEIRLGSGWSATEQAIANWLEQAES